MSVALVACSFSRRWAGVLALAMLAACARLKDDEKPPSPCAHAEPPGRPAPNQGAPPGDLDLTFAISAIDVGDSYDEGQRPRLASIGYDLDATCTGQGERPSCVEPAWATADHTDGPGGRDNSLPLATFPSFHAGEVSATITAEYQSGRQTTLFRIRGYNGDPNDDQVEVDVYEATMWEAADVGSPRPLFEGHDRWRVATPWLESPEDGSIYSVDRAKYRDIHAYVNNGIVVGKPDSTLLGSIFVPQIQVPGHRVIVTASLEKSGDRWGLRNGIYVGRIAIDDQLRSIPMTTDPLTLPLCSDAINYPMLRNEYCALVDIRATGDDPTLPCDATSSSIAFEAQEAELGGVFEVPQRPPACTPELDPVAHGCGSDR